jgi:hypothetical protein
MVCRFQRHVIFNALPREPSVVIGVSAYDSDFHQRESIFCASPLVIGALRRHD